MAAQSRATPRYHRPCYGFQASHFALNCATQEKHQALPDTHFGFNGDGRKKA
jgi:hypothetical protein